MAYGIERNTIGTFFRENTLDIPPIQRSYSWTKDKVEMLWDDLFAFIDDEERSFYLFHTVILVNSRDNPRKEILDGQQRTATMIALAAAVVNKIKSNSDEFAEFNYHADSYKRTFLKKENGEAVLTSFYRQDQKILEWLCTPEHEWERPIRNRKLAQHYWTFSKKIETILETAGTRIAGMRRIISMMDALCEKSYLSVAKFESIPEAVHAFDTTNNRGQDLTLTDLLRYWMLTNTTNMSDRTKSEVQNNWDLINEHLPKETVRKDFVVSFWGGELGNRKTQNELINFLNKHIREEYNTENSIKKLSRQLEKSAKQYHDLISPSITDINAPRLSFFPNKAKQHLTLLLAGKRKNFSDIEMTQLIVNCESLYVWFQLVAGKATNSLYQKYCNWAKIILDGQNYQDSIQSINTKISNFFEEQNIDFKYLESQFTRLSLDDNEPARYLLRHFQKYDDNSMVLAADQVELEHILPQNPSHGEWVDWNEDNREVYTNRIGNMCLLHRSDNVRISNSEFTIKQEAYQNSSIILTKLISDFNEWTISEVNQRQLQMFLIAANIWPIDFGN